ncbi:Hypothetical protein A7982_06291 [Minicystis rosea]|nr:Hypothetical protein A7982_06291 [Minicystis rosea]
MRIWDLRRGDDDDNRVSPHGRGLRSLVFSALLELNYLKAPIGFLVLILAPAFLVGVAPSLLVTYGRLVLHTSAQREGRPILAVLLVLLLVGIALWVGRPLARTISKSIWNLHYTLVFPMLVALREVLRTLADRLRGREALPEELDRGRRVGAVIAALLVGGAGFALALGVGATHGFAIVDVERARPGTTFTAALGNAAVIFGLTTIAESAFWIQRELSRRGPVRDWAPRWQDDASAIVRVAHLSDLHIVGERYGYRMEPGTRGPRGNGRLRNAFVKLTAIDAATPLDRIVLTGDVTDAGTRAEWAALLDLLDAFPALRQRVSFVPGNHDVNIIDRQNPGRLDLPWSAGQWLRKLRVVLALEAIQGDRAHVIDHDTGAIGPSLKRYLRERDRAAALRDLARRGTMLGRWEMAKVWDAVFPLVELPRPGDRYGVILLDSNASSHFALTNAIGVVSPGQLRALDRVLRNNPEHAFLILLHHQVVEHPMPSISLRERVGLSLINASDLMAVVTPHAARVLVLHGHRHRDWIGASDDVVFCSAPSTSLGSDAQSGYRGTFHIHHLALDDGGGVRLSATERVRVP